MFSLIWRIKDIIAKLKRFVNYWPFFFPVILLVVKYFITGMPGSGKSSVVHELKRRGYTAYDTDDVDGVTRLEDKVSGKPIPWPDGPADFEHHAWRWQGEKLKQLLASDELVYIGASVANQGDYYNLFDGLIALIIDGDTMEQRLALRTNNSFGNHPQERADMHKIHERSNQQLTDAGAFLIDAAQPLEKVVEDILNHTNAS